MKNHYEVIPQFLFRKEADFLEEKLETCIPWTQVKYYRPERGYVITPRLTWACGFHQETHYSLLKGDYTPNKIPSFLIPLKNFVEEQTDQKFNFILLSKYRNQNDSIAFHSDNEKFLGNNPVICSISIGYKKEFVLKNKENKEKEILDLKHGDLLIMKNNCQKDYEHAVLKNKERCYTRYSITFRKVINQSGSENYYLYNTNPTTKLLF